MPGRFDDGRRPATPAAVEQGTAASPDAIQLRLDGFEGPLDLLLDLARRQQVDLARISILTLVDQYLLAVSTSDPVDLTRAADWLVMAAWLTWLKSRLLLPRDGDAAKQADQAAKGLTDRLAALERVREIAAWLEAQPQLGRDIFERGGARTGPGPALAADFLRLFQACSDVLRGPDERTAELIPWPRRQLWSPHQALAHMRAVLGGLPEGGDLLSFVPEFSPDLPDRALRLRGAIASTVVASLELARDAQAELRQETPFGRITVLPIAPAAVTIR